MQKQTLMNILAVTASLLIVAGFCHQWYMTF